jgi:alpha-glucuronidase
MEPTPKMSTCFMPATIRCALLPAIFFYAVAFPVLIAAETGADAWLRYAALSRAESKKYATLPDRIVVLGNGILLETAQHELLRDLSQMSGRNLSAGIALRRDSAIVLGTLRQLHAVAPTLHPPQELKAEGYWLKITKIHGHECLVITAVSDRGVLYGAFALLSKIARSESLAALDEVQQPYAPIRWVNQWDNLDGRIERGYGGSSIFFADGKVRGDLTRAGQYARLLASVGINGCTVNNVNAAPGVLEQSFIAQVSRIADAFRP